MVSLEVVPLLLLNVSLVADNNHRDTEISDLSGLHTTISSLHRSKVGSISAAEAVKSLQQPVLLKADPLRSRGGLIFSRTLHSYPRLQPPTKVGIYVIVSY